MVCTFFGHRDCSCDISDKLKNTIENVIVNYGIDLFYVGCNGKYDFLVYKALTELSKKYLHIRYYVVLAYIPKGKETYYSIDKTIIPEGIEDVPNRFAIPWRNKWMISVSDTVIAYISHDFGGAYCSTMQAKRKSKRIINIYYDFEI